MVRLTVLNPKYLLDLQFSPLQAKKGETRQDRVVPLVA